MRVGAPSCKKPCEFRAGADSELFENLQSAVRQGTEMRRLRQKKEPAVIFWSPGRVEISV